MRKKIYLNSLLLFSVPMLALSAAAQVLSVGFYKQDEPKGLFSTTPHSLAMQGALFTTLVTAKEAAPGFGLRAATDLSIGPKAAHFSLKEGLHFEDGSPIGAYDVAYSLGRCSDEAKANLQLLPSGQFEIPLGAENAETGKTGMDSIEFLRLLASCPILPQDSERFGDLLGFNNSQISSGMYKVIEQSKPNVVWLTRTTQTAGVPQKSPEKIMLQDFNDDEKMLSLLRSGSLDAIFVTTLAIMDKVQRDQTLRVSKCNDGMLVYRRGLTANCQPRMEFEKWHYEDSVLR